MDFQKSVGIAVFVNTYSANCTTILIVVQLALYVLTVLLQGKPGYLWNGNAQNTLLGDTIQYCTKGCSITPDYTV